MVDLREEASAGPVQGRIQLQVIGWTPTVFAGDQVHFTTRLKRPTWYKNWGGFNYRRFLERQGILLKGYVDDPQSLTVLTPPKISWLGRLRSWMEQEIGHQVDAPGSAVLASLVTGQMSAIPEDLLEAFRVTGTSHLLAISGQNVGMVALFFYLPILWLLKRSTRLMLTVSVRSLATVLTLVPALGYVALAGYPVSAVRAGGVAVLIALAVLLRRYFDLLSALSLVAIVICLVAPEALFSLSFQLSFAAILAIALWAPWLASLVQARHIRGPRWLVWMVAQTTAATLGTAPLLLFHFGQVPLTGLVTNLWAIPFMTLLLGGLLLGLLIAPMTGWPLWFVGKLTAFFLWGIQGSAKYSLVATLIWPHWGGPLWQPSALRVHFLDVGQGDAIWIQTPHGKNVLVDAGGFLIPGVTHPFDVGEKVVVPYLERGGVKRIDRLILSHPHPDHFGGMPAVVRRFPVDEFWWNGDWFLDESFTALFAELAKGRVPRLLKKAPESTILDGVEFRVLSPEQRLPRDINNNSLVLQVVYGKTRFLLTGDMERPAEERLVNTIPDLRSDVLKVPHHGSGTSSSVVLLDAVRPQFAVVSLGEGNLFHFPSPGVLEKYQRRGVQVSRTDQRGAVVFTSDGEEMKRATYLPDSPN